MTEDEARRREAIIKLITASLTLAIMLWCLIPDHRRKLTQMRLAEASRRLCARAARQLARQSMTIELTTGQRRYEIPYLLSLARDKSAAWYESTRSVT